MFWSDPDPVLQIRSDPDPVFTNKVGSGFELSGHIFSVFFFIRASKQLFFLSGTATKNPVYASVLAIIPEELKIQFALICTQFI